jgi:hypothetical protein
MAVAVVVAAHAIAVPATKPIEAVEDPHPQLAKIIIAAMRNLLSHPDRKVVILPSDFGEILLGLALQLSFTSI